MAYPEPRTASVPDLITSLVADLADLVRKESALVRAEFAEKLARVAQAGAALAIAAALMLGALFALVAAIVLALSLVIAPLWACLVTMALLLAAGGLAAMNAMRRLKPAALKPTRTLDEAEQIARIARGLR